MKEIRYSLGHSYQYINVDRCESVRLSVCLCVTDVMSLPQRVLWERGCKVYYNAYAGNESPNCWSADMVSFIAPQPQLQEGYEGGTVDTRASKDCTIDEPDFIASYSGEAEV